MRSRRPGETWYERFLRWAGGEEPEGPEGPEDPERQEFQEYLEYIDAHGYLEFGAYRLMRWKERRAKGLIPDTAPEPHPQEAAAPRPPEPRHRPGLLRRQVRLYRVLSVCVTLALSGIFLAAALALPVFGDPSAPALNEVSRRYLEQGAEETGAVNAVTGLILDYRAFDTLGESAVLFAAAASVILLLNRPDRRTRTFRGPDQLTNLLGRPLLPVILLFGVYVILNGHLSPGGGFSGGAVLGGGLILASLVLGEERMERLLPGRRTTFLTAVCLLAYAVMKGYSFFTGGNHVGPDVPKGNPGDLFSGGLILPLNICVGIIVACTMYTFYTLFLEGEEER